MAKYKVLVRADHRCSIELFIYGTDGHKFIMVANINEGGPAIADIDSVNGVDIPAKWRVQYTPRLATPNKVYYPVMRIRDELHIDDFELVRL